MPTADTHTHSELPNVCVVSQYYRFGSLESVLRGPTRADLPWKAFVKMAKETAAGIHHLHKEGILHSRIASRNILVGDGCRAYVNDFAFCHFKPKEQVYAQSATQTFLGPGTPAASPPLALYHISPRRVV